MIELGYEINKLISLFDRLVVALEKIASATRETGSVTSTDRVFVISDADADR
jgi:hypothetical protein